MKFKEYLDNSDETMLQFSRRTFLAFNTILKIYRGGKIRRNVAKIVERATKKVVTIQDLGHESRKT